MAQSRGVLVYSTEHPIFTARLPEDGWLLDEHGQRTRWTLDRYADEDARAETWFVEGVRKYHRRLSTLVNGILDARPAPGAHPGTSPLTRPGWPHTPTPSTSAADLCSCCSRRANPSFGAEDEIRTRDPRLGKAMRYRCATSAKDDLKDTKAASRQPNL